MLRHLHYRDPRRRRKREKNLFKEIMAENGPNLGKKTDSQAQEAKRGPNKMAPKETHKTYHS